ncbi:hypothetical protein AWC03_23435 [Mycobacterium europaeum]|nr:hypothetical protein AWC03_23435 [Mycobacterium europaeum]
MTEVCSEEFLQAIGTPLHLLRPFDIDVMDADTSRGTALMAMSRTALVDPIRSRAYRRSDRWPSSSMRSAGWSTTFAATAISGQCPANVPSI